MRTWDKVLAKHPDITWYPTTCNNLRLLPEENGLEHVMFLNDNANARIACVDTGLTLFATDTDEEGYLVRARVRLQLFSGSRASGGCFESAISRWSTASTSPATCGMRCTT